jgi:hypothetical protein
MHTVRTAVPPPQAVLQNATGINERYRQRPRSIDTIAISTASVGLDCVVKSTDEGNIENPCGYYGPPFKPSTQKRRPSNQWGNRLCKTWPPPALQTIRLRASVLRQKWATSIVLLCLLGDTRQKTTHERVWLHFWSFCTKHVLRTVLARWPNRLPIWCIYAIAPLLPESRCKSLVDCGGTFAAPWPLDAPGFWRICLNQQRGESRYIHASSLFPGGKSSRAFML